jgi:large subunit ribosomal protein L3
MAIGLLAKKLGMTQLFNEHGRVVAVTVLQAGPCAVTQVKEPKTDGYRAVQVGFEPIKVAKLTKALQGHFKKSGAGPFRYLREFRLANGDAYTVGQPLTVELFQEGELVDVTGTSIGKGFQGGVKRWHWKGGPATHGSTSHRAPGSIGSTTFPGRVIKGHHLPGHMGDDRVTIQNLRIMKVDAQANLLVIEGALPGPEQRLVLVEKSIKRPGAIVAAKKIQETIAAEEEEKKPAKAKKK